MKRLSFFLLYVLITLAAAGCAAQAEKAEPPAMRTMTDILETGTLRVGTAVYAPWVVRGEDGELKGFEIDVARQVAKDLGVTPQIKVYEWAKLIPALLGGEIDIIIAGVSITPERAVKINFSQPYATSGTGLATNTALTKHFTGLTDLNDPDVTIAVVTGTVSESVARRTFKKATFQEHPTAAKATAALVNGKAHAFVAGNPAPRIVALSHPDKIDEPLNEPLLPTKEAFAIRKGDFDFLAFLNAWVVAREADTWLQGHHDYWFDSQRWRKLAAE